MLKPVFCYSTSTTLEFCQIITSCKAVSLARFSHSICGNRGDLTEAAWDLARVLRCSEHRSTSKNTLPCHRLVARPVRPPSATMSQQPNIHKHGAATGEGTEVSIWQRSLVTFSKSPQLSIGLLLRTRVWTRAPERDHGLAKCFSCWPAAAQQHRSLYNFAQETIVRGTADCKRVRLAPKIGIVGLDDMVFHGMLMRCSSSLCDCLPRTHVNRAMTIAVLAGVWGCVRMHAVEQAYQTRVCCLQFKHIGTWSEPV
eukprot:363900-Chlamydomonas_euryale.AAC.9